MRFCGYGNEMALTSALAVATVFVRWDTLTLLDSVDIPKANEYMSKQGDTLVKCRLLKAIFILICPLL